MKREQRDALMELREFLRIPLPQSGRGTQTASIRGMAEFTSEMVDIRPIAAEVLDILVQGESMPGELRLAVQLLRQALAAAEAKREAAEAQAGRGS